MALTDLLGGVGGGGNPIALAGAAAGIGLSIYGGLEQAKIQKEEAGISADIAGIEGQINSKRQQLATDIYQRQTTENYRNAAKARSVSRAAAVEGGAQYSSGAKAGEEQAASEFAFNQQGLYQNYQIGQDIFGLQGQATQKEIQLAQLGGQAATYGGIAAIGQGLTGGSMALGRLTGGFGGK